MMTQWHRHSNWGGTKVGWFCKTQLRLDTRRFPNGSCKATLQWFHESLETMGRSIDIPIHPSHVLLQMGVGSMAAAVVGHFTALPQKLPKFVVLEPKNAACGFESAKKGELTEVAGDLETMIAGLACGIPSSIAWPIYGGPCHCLCESG